VSDSSSRIVEHITRLRANAAAHGVHVEQRAAEAAAELRERLEQQGGGDGGGNEPA
jgi:hypothetical protein